MVGKLIGERGKTVVEISRDSKCRVTKCLLFMSVMRTSNNAMLNVATPQVTIPRVEEGKDTVIISIKGKKKDITTAQYLMQKILKGGK